VSADPIEKIFDRHGNEVSYTIEPCDQAVPEGLANTFANALSKDDQSGGTASGSAASVGWTLPMSGKTGTTESHRSSGFVASPTATPRRTIFSPTPVRRRASAPSHCVRAAAVTYTAATSLRVRGLRR